MKTLKTILCAVALAAAFVTAKADLVMTSSGTAQIEKTPYNPTTNRTTTATLSFNNKYIYTVISNAVANVATWAGTNIASTNLPADGYIAFNPTAYDGRVFGAFYVTNKSGFYYQLSGADTNGQYYSWIELDSENSLYGYEYDRFRFGFVNGNDVYDAPFNGTASYRVNSQGIGTETATSTALLYIHDDPYSYDDADHPSIYFDNYLEQGGGDDLGGNYNVIEVRGILTATLALNNDSSTVSSFSMTGSGNLLYAPTLAYDDIAGNLVKTATVKFAK